ncbi:MAG: ABC transporter permease [SAR324 cluster bacterium]|nr:ABC transporter permease [SAR324 cluster bacterium]MBL7034611.1 ABC transporter permease [SAR324 cluster bacterium]
MLTLRLAFRNLLRHKSRSLLCAMSMMGAYVLFSISLGFSDGSYGNLIRMLTDTHSGHVQIHKNGYLERPSLFRNFIISPVLKKQLSANPEIEAWAARIFSAVLIFRENKSTIARLMAIDPEQEAQVTTMREKVQAGKYLSEEADVINPILLGVHLQKLLQAKLGETLIFVGQGADGSIANDLFTVVGIVGKSSADAESRMIYMTLESAQEFLSLGGRIHEVVLRLENYSVARKQAADLQEHLKNKELDVQPWQVVEEQFYKAMLADQQGNWISQAIIMLIVGLVVLITVLMNSFERRHEYGLLLALGTPPGFIFRSIIVEMTLLSILSVFVGLFFSIGLNLYFTLNGIAIEPPMEYGGVVFSTMSSEVSLFVLFVPAVFTIGVAFLVAFFPAIKSARAIPIEAMREN